MKILIVRLSAMGDILLTTGPIRALKKLKPDLEVHLLTSEMGSEIYRGSIDIDKIHILNSGTGFWGLIKTYTQLDSYDKIIDLQAKPKTSLIRFFSKASFFQIKKQSKQRRAFVTKRKYQNQLTKHITQKYFEVFNRAFSLETPELEKLRPYMEAAPLVYADKGFNFSKSIVIHPYASQNNKLWPHALDLITDLHKEGLQTVIIGQGDPPSGLPKETLDLTNKTSLHEMASVIKSSKALVSTDSGPMHMGVSLNKPTLVIFGPTTKEFGFYPTFKNTKVVEVDLDCRPCHVHGGNSCPLVHHNCMQTITPKLVIESLKKLI